MKFSALAVARLSLALLSVGSGPLAAWADSLDPFPANIELILTGPAAADRARPAAVFPLTDQTISVIYQTVDLEPADIRTYDRETGMLRDRTGLPDDIFSVKQAVTDGRYAVLQVYANIDDYTHGAVDVVDATSMTRLLRVFAPEGEDRLSFGTTITIADGRLAVTAHVPDGSRSGRLYVYDVETGGTLYHIKTQPRRLASFRSCKATKITSPAQLR